MCMFIIDMDNTLIDTDRFRADRLLALAPMGVTKEIYWQTYGEVRKDEAGMFRYNDVRHAAALAKHGFDGDKILATLEKVTARLGEYVFPDTFDFLKNLRKYREQMILLSLGASSFQEQKVKLTGVGEHFDRVLIVDDTKVHVLKNFIKQNGVTRACPPLEEPKGARQADKFVPLEEKIWFINDKVEETKEILRELPRLQAILKVAQSVPMEEYIQSGLPYFRTLREIGAHIYKKGVTHSSRVVRYSVKNFMEANNANNTAVIILAAGEGKRMKSDQPKVMTRLQGMPLIEHVVANVGASGVNGMPVIVVSPKHTAVQDHLGTRAWYVMQPEQLGTGHAVMMAEPALKGHADHVVVLYGDMPFLRGGSIRKLVDAHIAADSVLTLMTVMTPDFLDWRSAFQTFGRIVRDESGEIMEIVEARDANEEQLGLLELSTCYFCFKADWLWEHLRKLKNENEQKEYYLTDLVGMAIGEGHNINSVPVSLIEAVGVNRKEDLKGLAQLSFPSDIGNPAPVSEEMRNEK